MSRGRRFCWDNNWHVRNLWAKYSIVSTMRNKNTKISNQIDLRAIWRKDMHIFIFFPFIPISPWASPNNPIFDLGLAGRFNPAVWWKSLFHQLAFMQFCLLVQFYGNAFPPFPQPGLDWEYVKEAINTSKQTSHPSVKGFIWNGSAGFYLFI